MVILKRLFSESKLFDEITFKSGLNIILGKYHTEKGKRGELNGIGKTKIIDLIDFLFLSNSARKKFDPKVINLFKNHSVCLELELYNSNFFYIKREFDHLSKVNLGNTFGNLSEYKIAEGKQILFDQLFGNLDYDGEINSSYFRDIIRFFIKPDNKLGLISNPVNFVHSSKKKSEYLKMNLFLLDLPNEKFVKTVNSIETIKDLKERKKAINDSFEDSGSSYQEAKAERIRLNDKIETIKEKIDYYEFEKIYDEIEEDIIDISKKISDKLKDIHKVETSIKSLERSIQMKIPEFDRDNVVKIYEEVNSKIAPVIKDKLDEILEFRQKLSFNRRTFLKSKIEELKESRKKNQLELKDLDQKRSKLYKKLDEKKALDSIKSVYEKMIEEKQKYEAINQKLEEIDEVELRISENNIEKSKLENDFQKQMKDLQAKIEQISRLYLNIVDKTSKIEKANEDAFLNIDYIESSANNLPLEIELKIPREDSRGKSRYKLLVYDLTIFLYNLMHGRNIPKFLIHDGIFSDIDSITKIKILNFIVEQSKIYNFQYITSFKTNEILFEDIIEDEIQLDFKYDDQVIKRLEDLPEKMLFGQEY